jgi:3-oxoacid CoA-transferase subunit A
MMNCFGITYFCIQGNNEERAENIQSYKEKEMYGGKVYVEDEYPNIVFAKSGELYNIDGKSVLVVGGAYSIDKDFKLSVGAPWFQSEQLTKEEKENILNKYKGMHIDVILTHTCPKKYEPTEVFDKNIDQTKVDKSMEEFLDVLEESIEYDEWYCGHYHIEKDIDKIKFMHKSIIEFNKKMSKSK